MYISEKIEWLLKYCSEYIDHAEQYDERQDENDKFQIDLGVEKYIKSKLDCKQLILLTGDAGDGKTRILFNMKKVLDESWEFINDFSEYTPTQKEELLTDLIVSLENKTKKYIIAANSGIFVNSIIHQNKHQLLNMIEDENTCIKLNFNSRNLAMKEPNEDVKSTMFYNIITEYLDYSRLEHCAECLAYEGCPFVYNIKNMTKPDVIEAIRVLFDTLYLMGLHITFRDLLSVVSYFITKARTCEEIKSSRVTDDSYYFNNIFSYSGSNNRLLTELSKLDVAQKDLAEFDYKVNFKEIDDSEHKIDFKYSADNILVKLNQIKRYLFFTSPQKLIVDYDSLYDFLPVKYVKEFRNLIDDLKENNCIQSMDNAPTVLKLELGLNKISNPDQSDAQLILFDSPPLITKNVRLEYSPPEKLPMMLSTENFYKNPNVEMKRKVLGDINQFYCFVYWEDSEEDVEENDIVSFEDCPTLKINYKLFEQIMLAKDDVFSAKSASISDNANIVNFTKSIFDRLDAKHRISIKWIGSKESGIENFDISFIKQPKFVNNKSSAKKINISIGK